MNYIELTLDTTGPQLDIIAPNHTTRDTPTLIMIQANERITQQEIYVIDNNGNRHDYTFSNVGESLEGTITFNGFPYGVLTIYARAKDAVLNQSELVSKSINLMESTDLIEMQTDFYVADLDIDFKYQDLLLQMDENIPVTFTGATDVEMTLTVPQLETEVKA